MLPLRNIYNILNYLVCRYRGNTCKIKLSSNTTGRLFFCALSEFYFEARRLCKYFNTTFGDQNVHNFTYYNKEFERFLFYFLYTPFFTLRNTTHNVPETSVFMTRITTRITTLSMFTNDLKSSSEQAFFKLTSGFFDIVYRKGIIKHVQSRSSVLQATVNRLPIRHLPSCLLFFKTLFSYHDVIPNRCLQTIHIFQ